MAASFIGTNRIVLHSEPKLMSSEITLPCRVSFGLFEADIKSGELWKAGYRVKLQSQPFKVLTILLENAGEVVSREELQRRVWGPDVIVDFEHSLGGAIKKIREALGDSAENPRFVETLARRGFRFIAPVRSAEEPVRGISNPWVSPVSTSSSPVKTELVSSALSPTVEKSAGAKRTNVTYITAAVCFGFGVLLMAAIAHFLNPRPTGVLPRISQITEDGLVYSPADPSIETLPASVTNGANIFTSYIQDGRVVLAQVSTSTGEFHILQLPNEIGVPEINDLSPDGSKLLVRSHLTSESIQPLWVVPVDGGSAFRVPNVLAQDATWMSDGKSILYASGDQLAVVSLETGQSVPFATVPGRAFWLRWSPDGKLVRFTLINPVDHTSSLWEISAGQHVARQILKNWSVPANECCGTWTSGGKYFVFQTTKDGLTDLWKLSGSSISGPLQVTNGPLSYEAPASARQGEQIFFVGHQSRSNLEQYDASRKEFVPRRDFLSDASRVSFSRDRQWVAWTGQGGYLWRAHADGTDKIRLTPESMFVFLAAWSPDGSRLALMAREPGAAWKIYLVRADGSGLECLTPQDRNVGDPSFSPDGRSIVFGQVTDLMGQETGHRSLEVLDLATKHTTDVPGSQGFFSPRWSPDGRYIAALTLDQQKVKLFDVANQTWSTLTAASAADPVWSADSKALYIHSYMDRTEPIYRVSVPEGRMEEVANLKSFPVGTTGQYFFSGLAPDNVLLVTTEVSSNNLYTMDLDSK
jgi:Tol biopolymer transport system component/DNA-binding winged helix-turn-helix (wHTH) protein